jgi:DNA repair exonuclease SbcCD nuclease subunit
MIKKIIHISDLHIRTFTYHELYEEMFSKLINEIKELTSDYQSSEIRIVITGDIVHQKINISNEQLLIISSFLNNLSEISKVIIIPGNHDFLENNMERIDSITPIIAMMNNKNITYYKDYGVYTDNNIKWVVYSLYQHNIKPEYEKEIGYTYIGLFHGPINGLTTDLNYVFDDVYDKINFIGCDIVLCGDIHKRQVINLEYFDKTKNRLIEIPIIQIGSLIQQNYGESIDNHGYGVYDVITNKYTFHNLENNQPFMFFKINDINDIDDNKEFLINNK